VSTLLTRRLHPLNHPPTDRTRKRATARELETHGPSDAQPDLHERSTEDDMQEVSKKTCSVDRCEMPCYQYKKMCCSHYMRWYRHGDPFYVKPRRVPAPRVVNKPRVLNLTGMQFGRLTVTESIGNARWRCECICGKSRNVPASKLRSGEITSCAKLDGRIREKRGGRARVENAAYVTVHARLRRDRGPAAAHPCVDCNGLGAHWSYDHNDPDQMVDRGLAYSLKAEHYAPRCNRCHATFDELGVKSAAYQARMRELAAA